MSNKKDEQIVLGLDIPRSVSQINADIQRLQNQLIWVKASGALDTDSTVRQINAQITALKSQLKTINIHADINPSEAQKTGQKAGQITADAAQKIIKKLGEKLFFGDQNTGKGRMSVRIS